MTIQAALDRIDEMKPNKQSVELKIGWLSELDGLIHREIILKHEHTEQQETFDGYDMTTDPATELIAPYPYDDIYPEYLAVKIDLQNNELGKYNTDKTMFNNAYDMLSDWWTRNHMPISKLSHFRL